MEVPPYIVNAISLLSENLAQAIVTSILLLKRLTTMDVN